MTTVVSGEKHIVPCALDKSTGELIEYRTFDEREQELKEIEKREKAERDREKHSSYKNFVQLNAENQIVFEKIIKENATAGRLFHFLIRTMDGYNAVVCSNKVIMEALEISISTIKRAVAYLKEGGYIDVGKSGTTNVYIVNPEIAWKSWGSNRKYCEFPANVVLAASENKQLKNKTKNKRENKVVINKK